ncbi:MAG: amino acid ABC transporter substrate-binding protein [Bdellovibrionales bacterium]
MVRFLKALLTGRDNATYDVARVLLFCGGLVFLACTLIDVAKGAAFEMDKFGYGFGALLGGGSAGIGLKGHTEPEQSP